LWARFAKPPYPLWGISARSGFSSGGGGGASGGFGSSSGGGLSASSGFGDSYGGGSGGGSVGSASNNSNVSAKTPKPSASRFTFTGVNQLEDVVIKRQSNAMKTWSQINSNYVSIVSGVNGIFENGAKFEKSVGSLAKDAGKLSKVLKVTGSVSTVCNISQAGSAFVNWTQDQTNENGVKFAAQLAIIGLEIGANALIPGTGIVVGLGLNYLEANFAQEYLYDRFK
jgi:hypothetical protein